MVLLSELGYMPAMSGGDAEDLWRACWEPWWESPREMDFGACGVWVFALVRCRLCNGRNMTIRPDVPGYPSMAQECHECGAMECEEVAWLHPEGYWVENDRDFEAWER